MAIKDLTVYGANGSMVLKTEQGQTYLVTHTEPGSMYTVLDNTPEVRRFLRAALKRMEAFK